MISYLQLQNTGPMRALQCRFPPRLNLLTGDNGLGKSFLLEVIWWAVTGTWAKEQAYPFRPPRPAPPEAPSSIAYELRHRTGSLRSLALQHAESYQPKTQSWERTGWYLSPDEPGPKPREDLHDEALFRPATLAVYARVDGGIALYDSYRIDQESKIPEAILLEPQEVFKGKKYTPEEARRRRLDTGDICNGLIRDWIDWEFRSPEWFQTFRDVLKLLSDQTRESLIPGRATRVQLGVSTDIPTLDLPYGNVPITFASAGMRRILSLAYALVWAWKEHQSNASVAQQPPVKDIVLLIDEAEAHLHPHWQRLILPAIQRVVTSLAPDVGVQLFVATHSPMVMASAEPGFDPAQDALWNLDLDGAVIRMERDEWSRRGDANTWLTDLFELDEPRSVPAEHALQEAGAVMERPDATREDFERVTQRLRAVLPGIDPFWGDWRAWARSKGFLSRRSP